MIASHASGTSLAAQDLFDKAEVPWYCSGLGGRDEREYRSFTCSLRL
jgi:hypothetical protein